MSDYFTQLAQSQPDKLAVIDDRPDGTPIQWTYRQLEDNANRLGRVLMDFGVQAGDKAIWCGQNSPWLVAMMHACRKTGLTSVPLNYRLSAEEATYVIDNSDSVIAFIDAEYADLFDKIRQDIPKIKNVLVFDGTPKAGQIDAAPLLEVAETTAIDIDVDVTQGSVMIYTSGTTGRPKGALKSVTGQPEQVARTVEIYGLRHDDVYITSGPLYHSGPSSFMATGFLLGQTAIVQRKFDAEDWLRLFDKYKVSVTFSAPTPMRRICNLPRELLTKYDFTSMRVLIANAAPWSQALKKQYLQWFPKESLFEVYGSTELGVNTILRPEYQLTKPGSCGKPAPSIEIKLYNDDGEEITTPHQPGELYVRSPSLFTAYYGAKDKFDADHKDGFQTVGDIAYFDEEGFYFICDRKNDMIISGGVNIYPAEIEAALEEHPDILEVAVFGIPDEEWGERIHAVVVKTENSTLQASDIEAYARKHLASYKVPRSFDFANDLPKTGSGKVLKRTLRSPYWKDHQTGIL